MPEAGLKKRESSTAKVRKTTEKVMRVGDLADNAWPDGPLRAGTSRIKLGRKSETDRMDRPRISSESGNCRHSATELAGIRARIKDGVYSRPSLIGAIVDKLIGGNVFDKNGAGDTEENHREQPEDVSEMRRGRVEQARRKVSRGEYSRGDVLQSIIDKLLDQLGIR